MTMDNGTQFDATSFWEFSKKNIILGILRLHWDGSALGFRCLPQCNGFVEQANGLSSKASDVYEQRQAQGILG